jgi:hypothetical protein
VTTALPLAEGYLRAGDIARARPLIQELFDASKAGGYLHVESGLLVDGGVPGH